ncbi:hypothetical protein YYG_05123 [Plasmodium vinckei petteri]|uniref:Fam-a protein n=1 Tax=Plasmodium vinckei petteri TaxID=138298 RepID=W7AEC6_PLAVN|nr:hypothetical protein YYG_05123 [Plasmodium vinckei petteri]
MSKLCVKIALALLSLAGYMKNAAFASENSANSDRHPCTILQNDEFEQYKNVACKDIDESILAIDNIIGDSELLLKLAENTDGYSVNSTEDENGTIYSKKIGNVDIGKLYVTIPSSSKYSAVLKNLWDFNDTQKKDNKFINGNIARVYCKYLIMFEKQNINGENLRSKKRYALGAKVKQSSYKTVIVTPSRPLNYDGEINQETDLKEIFENTKSIEDDIDAEEALIKLADNIAGFVVKKSKDDQVHVIYINAIYDEGNSTNDKKDRDITYKKILNLAQSI